MIHQYELWEYVNKKKRTDVIAKKFGLTTEQANHALQKLERFGHATKERVGHYSYWKAIPGNPPRKNVYEDDIKHNREMDLYTQMVFEGAIYKKQLKEKTGMTDWILLQSLKSLESQGHVKKVGRGWMAISKQEQP